MSRILEKDGTNNTNIDGARFNNFCAGERSGIIKSTLNECAITTPSSSVINIETGELLVSGVRVVLNNPKNFTFSTMPTTATRYSLIAEIAIDANSNITSRIFVQLANTGLVQNDLFKTENGAGTYQIELAKFTLTNDGIEDLVRTVDIITGSKSGGNGLVNIGTVETETLAEGLDAEVDVETVFNEEDNKYYTNFQFHIPKGDTGEQGIEGIQGETGNGITTIAKTGTSGLTDTYTITFTSGATTTFSVANGKGIANITKTGTSGLVDTYTIAFNDSTSTTFTVTNGEKGKSFNPTGEWSSATAYVNNATTIDTVLYLGSTYYCKQSNTNQTPTNTTYWGLLAEKGSDAGVTIVQTTGESETQIMSQKAVSDELKTCERIQNYVIFESDEPRTITPKYTQSGVTLQYSIDKGVSWINIAHNTATPSSAEIWFRGQATGNKGLFASSMLSNAWSFSGDSTNKLRVKGNLNYLLCDNLGDGLPATTLTPNCYSYMFYDCTSLTHAPELPATTLADFCYSYMFLNCLSLTQAPDLPATTLADRCYNYMFYNCISLTQIKCYYPSNLSNTVAESWLSSINTIGILYSPNGIIRYGRPTNWTSSDLSLARPATMGEIYPVGAIYISTVNTSPASLFGGSWTAYAQGRVLIGMGSNGETNYTTVGATGGSEDSVASHSHTQNAHTHTNTTTAGTLTLQRKGSGTSAISGNSGFITISTGSSNAGSFDTNNNNVARDIIDFGHSHTNSTETPTINSTGTTGGNRMPYITVYMWQRTA